MKVALCFCPSCVYHKFFLQLLAYLKVTATRKLQPLRPDNFERNGGWGALLLGLYGTPSLARKIER